MAYQAPGLIDGDKAVDSEEARTQMLAKAFYKASGGYFERLAGYEEEIDEAESLRRKMKYLGLAGLVVGLILVGAGIGLAYVSDSYSYTDTVVMAVSGVGALVFVVIGAYSVYRHRSGTRKIREAREKIEEDEPDGSVKFVSQINLPFYLVPYRENQMVFDGLNLAPSNTLETVNIDGMKLEEEGTTLTELMGIYGDDIRGEDVLDPRVANGFSSDASEHRKLELPITRQIDTLTDVMSEIERDEVSARVHANDTAANSLKALSQSDLLYQGNEHREVETEVSIDECSNLVNEIKGIDSKDEDVLDRAKHYREEVEEITNELIDKLEKNAETVDEHYDRYSQEVERWMEKTVCGECLRNRMEEVREEYDTFEEVLSKTRFGGVLDDSDLDEVSPGKKDEIHAEIREELPLLEGKILEIQNSLEDLSGSKESGSENYLCEVHGEVEGVEIPASGDVFAESWKAVQETVRESTVGVAESLGREAEKAQERKESKLAGFAEYERMKEDYEHEYDSAETKEKEAKKTVEKIREQDDSQEIGGDVNESLTDGGSKEKDGGGNESDSYRSSGSSRSLTNTLRRDFNLDSWMQDMNSQSKETVEEIRKTKSEISDLKKEVEALEDKIREIEVAKAESRVEVAGETIDDAEKRLERANEKYRRKVEEALGEYTENIGWLKDKFQEEVPQSNQALTEIGDSLERAEAYRDEIRKKASRDGEIERGNYESRINSVEEARDRFFEAADEFIEARKKTARTVEEMETKIPGIRDERTVHVPFWVAWIEGKGGEDIEVFPIQQPADTGEGVERDPDLADPYVDYLIPHEIHGYEGMVNDIQRAVAKQNVRDALEREESNNTFSTSDSIPREYVHERFLEELEKHELSERRVRGQNKNNRSTTGPEVN